MFICVGNAYICLIYAHFSDVPMAPAAPEVTSRKRDAMLIEWKPPRKNGGSEVTGYVIEAKERNSVLWKTLAKTHSTGK